MKLSAHFALAAALLASPSLHSQAFAQTALPQAAPRHIAFLEKKGAATSAEISLRTVNLDGSDEREINRWPQTTSSGFPLQALPSGREPGGREIAYVDATKPGEIQVADIESRQTRTLATFGAGRIDGWAGNSGASNSGASNSGASNSGAAKLVVQFQRFAEPGASLALIDLASGQQTPLVVPNAISVNHPAWSYSGQQIAFFATINQPLNLPPGAVYNGPARITSGVYLTGANGENPREIATGKIRDPKNFAFSRDDKSLLVLDGRDLIRVGLTTPGQERLFRAKDDLAALAVHPQSGDIYLVTTRKLDARRGVPGAFDYSSALLRLSGGKIETLNKDLPGRLTNPHFAPGTGSAAQFFFLYSPNSAPGDYTQVASLGLDGKNLQVLSGEAKNVQGYEVF